MQITGEWLSDVRAQRVMAMLSDAGFQAYVVGGCVRNALLDAPIADVDIATDARPDVVVKLAEAAGFHAIPTGIEHGTVTVVCDSEPFEITTFRNDVTTDGRRATVAFSDNITNDALRRDFTVNALYARADGTIVDPLGGLQDIAARRIKFIEDADKRIEEDYLRILRFFRFYAWYGDPEEGIEPNGLAACASHTDGISALSKERLGAEMSKLLAAPDPAPTLAAMAASGVLGQVIAGADTQFVGPLVHIEGDCPIRWQRRLAVLGGENVGKALRLSNADKRYLSDIKQVLQSTKNAAICTYLYGGDETLDAKLVEAASIGGLVAPNLDAEIKRGVAAVFPVQAADLFDRFDKGPALGAELKRLKQVWLDSDMKASKSELLTV